MVLTFLSLVGCSVIPSRQPTVEFTFDNRTQAMLCEYPSRPDAAGGRCLAEIAPGSNKTWSHGCGYGTRPEDAPVTVVLTEKGGQDLYIRTRTCDEWRDTNRRFVIEQVGNEFIVTEPE